MTLFVVSIFVIVKPIRGNMSSSSFTWCSIALSIRDGCSNQDGSKTFTEEKMNGEQWRIRFVDELV